MILHRKDGLNLKKAADMHHSNLSTQTSQDYNVTLVAACSTQTRSATHSTEKTRPRCRLV